MKTAMHFAVITIWFMYLARGVFSKYIYVNASGKNQILCGSIRNPCSSISFTINNVSNPNDTICLIASPVKQIRYTVENTIIIKHSLTVTKFPTYSQNPLITYDLNVTGNRKEFYAFAIFRYALAPNILTLNIKSVNFNVKILTTFSDGFKALQKNRVATDMSDFHSSLSISDSVVSSTSHAINFSNESEYENLTIHLEDLVIKSGDFMFKNKRDRCKPSEHIKDIIEMYNVTICNTGNVTLTVHGCFNMSIEKLTCSNITWKKQEMFTFTGGVLNTKNVLIKNSLANNNIKYNIFETKPLFLIKESVAKIQNTLIEESVVMPHIRPKRFSAMIVVQNSVVQILDMEVVGNSFRNFVQVNKSSLCFKNITLIENNVAATLCRAEESNVTLHEIKFYRNKIGCLVSINLNSKVWITNNSLTENRIFEKAYSISRSLMKLNNTNFRGNYIKKVMLAKSQSHIYINNVTFTNNQVIKAFFNISRESKLEMYNAEFLRNNIIYIMKSSSSQHVQMAFTGHNAYLLDAQSNSSAIIQNNTLTQNAFWLVYNITDNSSIQLNHVEFTQNIWRFGLFYIESNSSAIIRSNVLIKNVVMLGSIYITRKNSSIQLNHVAFTQNMIALDLLFIELNSRAIIQNNTLIQNFILGKNGTIYLIRKNSSIQLYHVAFIRNKWKYCLLDMESNSSAIIRSNVLIENNSWGRVYNAVTNSRIQLNHVVFKRNMLAQGLLYAQSNSSAIIQNNTLIKNSISWLVYGIVKNSSIQLNHVEFSRNKFDQVLLFIAWNSSAIIQNNTLIENNISLFLNIMSYSNAIIQNGNLTENNLIYIYQVKNNSTIQLINVTFIGNVLQKNLLTVVSSSRATLINIRMVENRFNRMFVAHSSDLEFDTIFIKKNALYQLIWVAKCKVSFELMKIRENNVTFHMIHAESSAGRITNTYIENSNNILVSAFRTTCTFLGNSNIYFEITNITITVLWSSEVLTFAPPIIQLCGNVSLSNVKLLITSLFETVKILQYSTKDVLLSENGSVITVTNNYKFSSLFISCTKASVKYIIKSDTFQCIPCARGTYGLNNGSLNTSLSFQSNKITKHESTNFTCLACPVGASCTAFIRSKSNFYGYKTKEQKLKFLPCPSGFCCTGNQCRTINSCNKNRIGTLCGRCIESYVESYLSTECISIHSCKNFPKFWLLYCISASVSATFLYYMKDFITLIKTIVSNFSKIFKPCKKEKESDGEIDIMVSVVGPEEDSEKTSHFTVSGIFTLIVSFYQIKQLMSINVQYKKSTDFYFITFITDFLNLEMVTFTFSSLCPMSNLDAVSKAFIKTYLLTATLIIACLINYFISAVFHFFRSSVGRLSSLKPSDRLGVCFIRVLMLSYKNMASASLVLLNCVQVADNKVLFIKGDMKCYQWWQIVIAVFFFTWILFFPLSLKVSFNMFMKDKISFGKFILCLVLPFAVVTNYRLNRNFVDLQKSRNAYKVKEILREMFQESYRLKTDDPCGETVFYETWRLYQRVLLAIVATFCMDPLKRSTLMIPVAIIFAISYYVIKPYKPEMYILHWIEVFSILGIFVCIADNMFRGFLYLYDIGDEDFSPVNFVWQAFAIFDLLFSPICVLIYFFIVPAIYNTVKCKLIAFYMTMKRE